MWPEAKASGRRNRAPEESQPQEPQEASQTCDQATPTPEKVKDQQRHEKVDEPRRAVETANYAATDTRDTAVQKLTHPKVRESQQGDERTDTIPTVAP